MKANRKALKNDEDAVSPVIAVILMVAITVVLAATVFVLVSNIGKNVGSTGPQFQMVSGTQTGGSQWVLRVAAVNVKHDISDYQFVHTLPNLTKVIITPPSIVDFNLGTDCWVATFAGTGSTAPGALINTEAVEAAGPVADGEAWSAAGNGVCPTGTATSNNWKFIFKDVSGDDKFSTGDEVAITYDGKDAGEVYTDTFPTGEHVFEIRHKTSDTLAGSLTRTA